jgi:hypothetical protein
MKFSISNGLSNYALESILLLQDPLDKRIMQFII